jgi:hypothetical protein
MVEEPSLASGFDAGLSSEKGVVGAAAGITADGLIVDWNGLSAVAGRFRSLGGLFSGLLTVSDADEGALGDPGLAEVVNRFVGDLRDTWEVAERSLQSLPQMLSSAIETYRAADNGMAGS